MKSRHSIIAAVVFGLALAGVAHAGPGNDTYYQIGGGSPVSVSAGRGHQPGDLGLGIQWDAGSSCSGLNPETTVENQLNGASAGFQNMMSTVVQNAQAAVAALPAMIIQRAAPGLYDLLSNGVLQGKLNFNKAKASCRAMSKKAAEVITSGGWQQQAEAESWHEQAKTTPDAVAARQNVEAQGGNNGVTWVGGDKAGGANQQPIHVTRDTAIAGYDMLYGRNSATSTAPVAGGGHGWGSMPSTSGAWPGARSGSAPAPTGGCQGGMCTVWGTPTEAANWIKNVVGERTIQTCSGCDKMQAQAGTGLMQALQKQQDTIQQKLTGMVNGSVPVNPSNLRAVSAGAGMSVSPAVINALQHDPKSGLLTHRLASEMALGRTLTQAIWARRVLLAGTNEPGIADNKQGQTAIDRELTQLDRGIKGLRTEMDVRRSLAHNAASVALTRQNARGLSNSQSQTHRGPKQMNSENPMQAP